MTNDNHDVSVYVRRSPLMIVVGVITVMVTLVGLALAGLVLAAALSGGTTASVDVPLGENAIPEAVADWKTQGIAVSGQITVPLDVPDAPEDVLQGLAISRSVLAITYLILASTGLVLSLLLLIGRLSWRWLAPVALSAGLLLAIGETVAQVGSRNAAIDLSLFVQRELSEWTEPGFGYGINPILPALGLVVASASVLFLLASRYAHDVEGLV